jgi:hypothetical protein
MRPFKGIICADVSEFESYMPSHDLWAGAKKSRRQKPLGGFPSSRQSVS